MKKGGTCLAVDEMSTCQKIFLAAFFVVGKKNKRERMSIKVKRAPPTSVVVHPLVLLSTVDHYNRVAKDTKKRVVGVLLGEVNKGVVDITNSYAGILLFSSTH